MKLKNIFIIMLMLLVLVWIIYLIIPKKYELPCDELCQINLKNKNNTEYGAWCWDKNDDGKIEQQECDICIIKIGDANQNQPVPKCDDSR